MLLCFLMIDDHDNPFIEEAIRLAAKSEAEPQSSCPKPKVGAVLVKDGQRLGGAFRGDTGEGEHAEYGLLEKRLRDDNVNVPGGTLYTTLEPCTSRGEEKTPCAHRIVERRLARVVIGMLDPNQEICGRGVQTLRDAGIEVDLFPSKQMSRVEDQNREFIKDQKRKSEIGKQIPIIGLTLTDVELERAPEWHYKFKLRLFWVNDGDEVYLGEPQWISGGIGIQDSKLGYKYQIWIGNLVGPGDRRRQGRTQCPG